jgi:hypothetical protein
LGIDELEELTRALESEAAGKTLLDAWLLERALPESLSKTAIRKTHRRAQSPEMFLPVPPTAPPAHSGKIVRGSFWRSGLLRTVGAAAAGLVLGAFSASLVFGKTVFPHKKVVRILEEGFESGRAPDAKGVPRKPGFWGGDYADSVPEQGGVKPRTGQRMLKFVRADYEGKPAQFSYSADLYRLIDLQGQNIGPADGETSVIVEANFRSVPFQPPSVYGAHIWVHAFEALPGDGVEGTPWFQPNRPAGSFSPHTPSASTQRALRLDPSGAEWQPLRVEMRVPQGTRYLMLSIHVTDSKAGREQTGTGAVEFPGQFLDDVQVSLIRDAGMR